MCELIKYNSSVCIAKKSSSLLWLFLSKLVRLCSLNIKLKTLCPREYNLKHFTQLSYWNSLEATGVRTRRLPCAVFARIYRSLDSPDVTSVSVKAAVTRVSWSKHSRSHISRTAEPSLVIWSKLRTAKSGGNLATLPLHSSAIPCSVIEKSYTVLLHIMRSVPLLPY